MNRSETKNVHTIHSTYCFTISWMRTITPGKCVASFLAATFVHEEKQLPEADRICVMILFLSFCFLLPPTAVSNHTDYSASLTCVHFDVSLPPFSQPFHSWCSKLFFCVLPSRLICHGSRLVPVFSLYVI